jgi:3-oxoacyl-[acyl-carrier protein] reductase
MYSLAESKTGYTLITGATSTIGADVARRRSATDRLLLQGRDMKALEVLALELGQVTEVMTWCRDLVNPNGLHGEFLQLLERNDIRVERVVHAAGHLKILPFRSIELADTMDIFNVNVFSIIEMLRVLARKPHRECLKSVVLLSAFFSKFGDKGNAIYSSSKGALNSLIKGLAVEFPQTRYNSLILGAVRTRMTEHLFAQGEDKQRFSRYLLGTGRPSDVTDAIDFLLQEALWMTGQEVFLDGGASIA